MSCTMRHVLEDAGAEGRAEGPSPRSAACSTRDVSATGPEVGAGWCPLKITTCVHGWAGTGVKSFGLLPRS